MNAFFQALCLFLAVTAVAHAAEKQASSKPAVAAAIEPEAAPIRTDRLDPRVIERAEAQRRTPKAPVFPAERR